MRTVTWAGVATDEAMGLQAYEHRITRAVARVGAPDLAFRTVRVRSLRGSAAGARRVPLGLYERAPWPVPLALGAWAYGLHGGLVHRFDLRIPPAPGPEVVTVHDLPSFHFPDEGVVPRSAAAGARRARRVICPSEFARSEVCRLLGVAPERVRVIPNGVGVEFAAATPMPPAELAALGVRGRYVLHAAGATQRKNLGALAGAWPAVAELERDVTLVLCGPADSRRDALFDRLPRTCRLGAQPPARVAALMAGASAVVVPSLYEGFGLPALEAMAAGAPVVAARTGALPEVCGSAARLVDADADGLAAGLIAVLGDPAAAAGLRTAGRTRAAGFSWTRAADQHLDVYREVLDG